MNENMSAVLQYINLLVQDLWKVLVCIYSSSLIQHICGVSDKYPTEESKGCSTKKGPGGGGGGGGYIF